VVRPELTLQASGVSVAGFAGRLNSRRQRPQVDAAQGLNDRRELRRSAA